MAYRSFLDDVPGNLKRSLSEAFVIKGRSTRTELVTFYLASQIAIGMVLTLALWLSHRSNPLIGPTFGQSVSLLFSIPLVALLVRRMHDQGRTGWWVLPYLILVAASTTGEDGRPYAELLIGSETPISLGFALIGIWLGLVILALLPPTTDTNEYGPNPRLEETEISA
jgi:uncharacterized membrane protein YhaH (DUF805 family)